MHLEHCQNLEKNTKYMEKTLKAVSRLLKSDYTPHYIFELFTGNLSQNKMLNYVPNTQICGVVKKCDGCQKVDWYVKSRIIPQKAATR